MNPGLEFVDADDAKFYLELSRRALNQYLKDRIEYFDDIAFFFTKEGFLQELYLVVILGEDCPYYAAGDTDCGIAQTVFDALDAYHPLPHDPDHTVHTLIADYVVVKRDSTSTSGYPRIVWPLWVRAANGEYDD